MESVHETCHGIDSPGGAVNEVVEGIEEDRCYVAYDSRGKGTDKGLVGDTQVYADYCPRR